MILNIIVLIFEVLYYSMFMYYARKEGKLWKYILLFSIVTIICGFINTKVFLNYLFLIIFILIGYKILINKKIIFFDVFIIFLMMIFKILFEFFAFYFFSLFFCNNISIIIFEILRLFFVLYINFSLKKFFDNIKIKWDKNDFYIRYLFIIISFSYVIFSCLYLIYA